MTRIATLILIVALTYTGAAFAAQVDTNPALGFNTETPYVGN